MTRNQALIFGSRANMLWIRGNSSHNELTHAMMVTTASCGARMECEEKPTHPKALILCSRANILMAVLHTI